MDPERKQNIDSGGLLRGAIPAAKESQISIANISSKNAQDTIDAAWLKLDIPTPLIHDGSDAQTQAAHLRKLCRDVSVKYQMLPSTFYLTGVVCVNREPSETTRYVDIYEGKYQGASVVLKRPRILDDFSGDEDKKPVFCCESILWSKLSHRHVLPLLGVSMEALPDIVCAVLPKLGSENLRQRLMSREPDKQLTEVNYEQYVNRWLHETAQGLAYLHHQGVVHGDLHGGNLLIDDADSVRISDFGIAIMSTAIMDEYGSGHAATAYQYMAPELLDPELFESCTRFPSTASDIYAFACTAIELYTGKVPFSSRRDTLYAVSKRVGRGERPPRPCTPFGAPMGDALWELVEKSWAHQPKTRLTAAQVAQGMETIARS
ncbi:hypothetical protein EIP91_002107 [Steccherinum ochraceum]|uniref:Protein kinase domain-containing protein n=1 Tax=Steccherinum ochraceum TaxID=92696 RepID=A0A4R0RPT8_9APHY|nr:hypothetical protein EIP91_002107 [Steccherinum ochraceum]